MPLIATFTLRIREESWEAAYALATARTYLNPEDHPHMKVAYDTVVVALRLIVEDWVGGDEAHADAVNLIILDWEQSGDSLRETITGSLGWKLILVDALDREVHGGN